MTRSLSVFTVWLALGAVAYAEPPAKQPADDVTTYGFEDDKVLGDSVGPNLEVLHARKRSERRSLVRVRGHYIPELLKSAEDL